MVRSPNPRDSPEAGYVLIGVVFFVALVLLSLAIAAPKVAAAIQRDRELELINRGEQYKRAIKLYYKKFGSYPGTMEQLEKSNNIRFLRKRYTDPLTGKDDWKLIHIGEAHLRPLGFFGKPLTATGAVGGATGLNGGTSTTLGQGSQTGQPLGTSSSGTSTFGGTTSAPGGSSGGLYAGVDNSGTTGSGSGSGDGSSSGTSTGTGSTGSSTGFGASTSQTLGGAPIVGVVIASTKTTIVEYKLQKTYKDWEFVYDPVAEQAAAAGSLLGGGGNINGSSGTSGGIGGSGNPTNAGGFGVNGGSINGAPTSGSGSNSGTNAGSTGTGSGSGITPQ